MHSQVVVLYLLTKLGEVGCYGMIEEERFRVVVTFNCPKDSFGERPYGATVATIRHELAEMDLSIVRSSLGMSSDNFHTAS